MLDIERCFVLVIDVQGNLAKVVADSEVANENIRKLVQGSLALEVPIFLTAQAPDKIGHTTEAIRALLPEHHEYDRTTFSIWLNDALRDAIQQSGKTQAILCGFESHVCVYQSATDLKGNGFEVWMVADAVSSRSLVNKDIALTEMRAEGVHLSNVEMTLFALLRDARHPAFRSVSKTIR